LIFCCRQGAMSKQLSVFSSRYLVLNLLAHELLSRTVCVATISFHTRFYPRLSIDEVSICTIESRTRIKPRGDENDECNASNHHRRRRHSCRFLVRFTNIFIFQNNSYKLTIIVISSPSVSIHGLT